MFKISVNKPTFCSRYTYRSGRIAPFFLPAIVPHAAIFLPSRGSCLKALMTIERQKCYFTLPQTVATINFRYNML